MVQISEEARARASKSTNGRKPDTALQAAPSGVDELPIMYQASIFVGIYLLLGLSTTICVKSIDSVSKSAIGLERWRNSFIDTSIPIILGFFYCLAGVGHFASADAFQDIYPPRGTWGLWYLPGSAEFHVAWTGVVELLGGGGLLFGGMRCLLGLNASDDDESWFVKLLQPSAASALFFLTVLVTPANIYMYTHGATMGDSGALDVSFHYIRFGFQVLFLSLLFVLAKDSFFFAWGDELD